MKSAAYILAISALSMLPAFRAAACGLTYYPPQELRMFRVCTPELERQMQKGGRLQEYDMEQNCILWQRMTSASIPTNQIRDVVYRAKLSDLKSLSKGKYSSNAFAKWLLDPSHREDYDFLLTAKEIEEVRESMNDPWYYPYEKDEEHTRLNALMEKCSRHSEGRNGARYLLQRMRILFSYEDFNGCVALWESFDGKDVRNIVTEMAAGYVGGAYYRLGDKEKAKELYTYAKDISSLASLSKGVMSEKKSAYSDSRVRELEYIFNRVPDSPVLAAKLQKYVRAHEDFVHDYENWKSRGFHDPCPASCHYVNGKLVVDADTVLYAEIKAFSRMAASDSRTENPAMWAYASAFIDYLDGNMAEARQWLAKAEKSKGGSFVKESIHAFRMLTGAHDGVYAQGGMDKLRDDLKWLDDKMASDLPDNLDEYWRSYNSLNISFYYWQDVAKRVLLGEVCPRLLKDGDPVRALQLANYASNRLHQLSPEIHASYYDRSIPKYVEKDITMAEYRKSWPGKNYYDWASPFFEMLMGVDADAAASYATRLDAPVSELDSFLNGRGYTGRDYIYDAVGTLYLREMRYADAVEWLGKVSSGYQARTNIAKQGFFKRDPFQYQDKKHLLSDCSNYKLKFAREMLSLERTTDNPAVEANKRAEAEIKYATGLRNSFGTCWYLTQYGFNVSSGKGYNGISYSRDRAGFASNEYAKKAYAKADALVEKALTEFTDAELAAKANLNLKNYRTVLEKYPDTEAASSIHGRCDSYRDYAVYKL